MDGDATTRQQLITTNIVWPNGLSLDFAQNKMYWIDSKLKRLEVAGMDGKGRVLLSDTKIEFPFALADFEDYLFWTDWKSNGIKMTNKFNGSRNIKPFSANHIAPMGIKVYHPIKQPKGKSNIIVYFLIDILVSLFVCWFVCLLVYLFVGLFVCWFVCWFVCCFVCLFVALFVGLFLCLLVCFFVCFLICLFVGLFVCWFVCLFVCLLVCFFVCFLVCLFVGLFVCWFVCWFYSMK